MYWRTLGKTPDEADEALSGEVVATQESGNKRRKVLQKVSEVSAVAANEQDSTDANEGGTHGTVTRSGRRVRPTIGGDFVRSDRTRVKRMVYVLNE